MIRIEKIKALARFIPALLWMGVIFWFSDQPADVSTDESVGIARQLVEIYAHFSGMEETEQIQQSLVLEPYLRKAAHMSEYALLAVLLYFAISAFSSSYRKAAAISLIVSMLYSCTDEWHQTFVFGRAGKISDVLIDTLGAAIGLLIVYLIKRRRA